MDIDKGLIEIRKDIYVYVEKGWENEAESYCVGARLRASTFDLDELDKVISYIKEEMD